MRRGVELQPDDIKVFGLLGGPFLVLNLKQIAALLDRSEEALRIRLEKLVRGGFLNRREAKDAFGDARLGEYYLGAGAQKVLDPESKDEVVGSRVGEARSVSDIVRPHLRLVNWIYIKFITAGRQYEDYEFEAVIPQYAPLWGVLNRHGLPVQPDGYVRYVKGGVRFHVFIEADRDSYRGYHVEKKVEGYWRYADSGLAEDQFSTSAFRVVFITESGKRARSLVKSTSRFPPGLFWVSVQTDFFWQPLFAAYWRLHGSEAAHSLDEPPIRLPTPA